MIGDREVLVTGDRDLIFDAIANLVDNAIKHGRNGGQVVVASENVDGGAVVSITDTDPEFQPINVSRFLSASIDSNRVATRRETASDLAWSPPSPAFMVRGSKCLITRLVSNLNFGSRLWSLSGSTMHRKTRVELRSFNVIGRRTLASALNDRLRSRSLF